MVVEITYNLFGYWLRGLHSVAIGNQPSCCLCRCSCWTCELFGFMCTHKTMSIYIVPLVYTPHANMDLYKGSCYEMNTSSIWIEFDDDSDSDYDDAVLEMLFLCYHTQDPNSKTAPPYTEIAWWDLCYIVWYAIYSQHINVGDHFPGAHFLGVWRKREVFVSNQT